MCAFLARPLEAYNVINDGPHVKYSTQLLERIFIIHQRQYCPFGSINETNHVQKIYTLNITKKRKKKSSHA